MEPNISRQQVEKLFSRRAHLHPQEVQALLDGGLPSLNSYVRDLLSAKFGLSTGDAELMLEIGGREFLKRGGVFRASTK
jgi:hypothetical protein